MMHVFLWKSPAAATTLGPLTAWQRYDLRDSDLHFRPVGVPAALNVLAAAAIDGAIAAGRNVTIARQAEDPEKTPSTDLLATIDRQRPLTIICPERTSRPGAVNSRWVIAWLLGDAQDAQRAKPENFPETAIQAAANDFAKEKYPAYNRAPSFYAVPFLALRHDVTAEGLGLVEALKITPDIVYASVQDDPEVIAAGRRWDRATPSTYRDCVRAVLAAQERAGIAEADRAPLSSGEVETYFRPPDLRRV